MSLETSLELNNKLLTQHNALLERLITALASGAALPPDTVVQVQEYRETAPDVADDSKAALTLDDMEFADVIALASFYPVAKPITEEMLQRAIDYRDAIGEARVVQIDALYMALTGVKSASEMHNPGLLDLSRHILRCWDELPTIADRRDFAERLLDAPATGRDEVKPKKAAGKGNKPQERKGPFYWKRPDGSAIGEESDVTGLNSLIDSGEAVEINKVEYLQLKEAADKANSQPDTDLPDFAALRKEAEGLILQLAKGGYRAEAVAILEKQGAQKLGGVADEKLVEVITQAKKALEG